MLIATSGGGVKSQSPYITLDDCLPLAQVLADRLKILGEQKFPLEIRRGTLLLHKMQGRASSSSRELSRMVRAGNRTYFLDIVRGSRGGQGYLRLTESRVTGKSQPRQRVSIILDPESAQQILKAMGELISHL